MATRVEKTIQVDVPVRTAYDQWTQFEEFPRFMGGVEEIRQLGDEMTHWVVSIGGVRREFDARILEQVPDTKVAWAATSGATNAGAVYFTPVGASSTLVRLEMEYEPEGVLEKVGDAVGVVERRAEGDLERFKEYIEGRGAATGGWRGATGTGALAGTPGVEAAAASRGDDGGAGLSTAAKVIGGVAAAAGAAAVAAAVVGSGDDDEDAPDRATTAAASQDDDVFVVQQPPPQHGLGVVEPPVLLGDQEPAGGDADRADPAGRGASGPVPTDVDLREGEVTDSTRRPV